jgi:hypothetical protein
VEALRLLATIALAFLALSATSLTILAILACRFAPQVRKYLKVTIKARSAPAEAPDLFRKHMEDISTIAGAAVMAHDAAARHPKRPKVPQEEVMAAAQEGRPVQVPHEETFGAGGNPGETIRRDQAVKFLDDLPAAPSATNHKPPSDGTSSIRPADPHPTR